MLIDTLSFHQYSHAAAVPQDLQSKGNSSPMSRHLSSIEGETICY